MGGSGSGRWGWHSAQDTVENTMSIDVRKLYGDIIPREYFQQQQRWTDRFSLPFMGEVIVRSYRELSWDGHEACLTLNQSYGHGISQRNYTQQIRLTSTTCNYGRERWWLVCPHCKRRCTCLYMRRESRVYRCRKCENLTYRSIQEAHKSDRAAKVFGINLSIWDKEMANQKLVERWHKKEHLTKGERRKIATYLGLPLFMIRNYFYKRETRLKILSEHYKPKTADFK